MPEGMSEYMPDRMPERMSEYMPERMTSRWYVRNYVRIMDQGRDHSNKVMLFSCLFFWYFHRFSPRIPTYLGSELPKKTAKWKRLQKQQY